MNRVVDLERLANSGGSRRSFVRNVGIAGAVGAFVASEGRAQTPTSPDLTDIDILNFALNLEYLEAEFYSYATSGQGISGVPATVGGGTNSAATTGGKRVSFSDTSIEAVAKELAANERSHVTLLQTAITGLGGTPIAKPAIKLDALGFAFDNQTDFLILARIFEDIGVTAYGGAAPLIQNKVILGYAARILAVEAEHAGNIRLQIARNSISTTAIDPVDHVPPPSGTLYFSTNSNALTEVRTPAQVLFLAYGNAANATSGGFFPAGVNGRVNMASATADKGESAALVATPNPIPVSGNDSGTALLTFSAPGVTSTQIRIGSPSGPPVGNGGSSGTVSVGGLREGTMLFLQNTGSGDPSSPLNTLGVVTIHLKQQ